MVLVGAVRYLSCASRASYCISVMYRCISRVVSGTQREICLALALIIIWSTEVSRYQLDMVTNNMWSMYRIVSYGTSHVLMF
jgi:hypothetical protein